MTTATSTPRADRVAKGLLFTLMGMAMLAIAGWTLADRLQFLDRAQPVQGWVDHLNAGGSHPQVVFQTPAGQRVSYAQNGLIFGYAPGQPVRVLYLPEAPARDPVVDTPAALWGVTVLIGLIGAVFVFAGLGRVLPRR